MGRGSAPLLTVTAADGGPGERVGVLFRWEPGHFLDEGLTPAHMEHVGAFVARLHEHARGFAPPPDFVRWRVADLSGDLATTAAEVVGEVRGTGSAALVATVLGHVEWAKRELGEGPEDFGLIHADLHQENYLFDREQVRAIAFDDCGWDHVAYDLSVVLSELRGRPDSDALCAGLLRGYRAVRPFPAAHERHLEVFQGLRMLLLVLWLIEQRARPAFPDWADEVDDGLEEVAWLSD